MIRLLATNGCSQARGTEMDDPETQAWPAVLARELGVPHVNMARDGASNRRIVRTTVARLPIVCQEAAVRPDEVLVVIAWTHSVRHEFYRPGTRAQPLAAHPVDHNWEHIGPWRRWHRPTRAFYNHLWSEEGQVTNFFLDWLLLDRFLGQEGYQARYAFAGPEVIRVPEAARPFLRPLRSETTFGGLPPAPGTSLMAMSLDRDRGPGGQPLADSHARFARALSQWIAAELPIGLPRLRPA